MRIPAPLPGFVPNGGPVVLPQTSGTTLPNTERPNEPSSDKTGIRPEFRKLLEQRLDGWLGEPGSERHATVAKQARPFMGQDGDFRIDALPDDAKKELVKLQKAAEGIEAIFVRQLLSQMRRISFDGKPKGAMAQFATDTMDQAVADQAAKGRSSVGIAKIVFIDNAQTLVKSAVAEAARGRTETKS